MRSYFVVLILFTLSFIGCAESSEPADSSSMESSDEALGSALSEHADAGGVSIEHDPADAALAKELAPVVVEQVKKIEEFFGEPFVTAFTVRLFPDRTALDNHWASNWGGEGFKSQCWIVASGIADELAMLSPRVWKEEACEHDPDDPVHVARIIAHELTHVYHGQRYTTPDFTGMDDLGWFAEGVAVLASGQLDDERRADAREAIEKGFAPTRLEEAWSGQYRYAIGGTLAEFVYERLGRDGLRAALSYEKLAELLEALDMSANEVLAAWREGAMK